MEHPARIQIIIPCYNPPEGWAARLIERAGVLQRELGGVALGYTLVNDGSTRGVGDAEREAVRNLLGEVRWIDHAVNKGKGTALRTGVQAGGAAIYLFTDVDIPYTVSSMVRACNTLLEGADVVLGYRQDDYYDRVPLTRRMISKTFRWVLRNVMRFPISDTQCGLKGFNEKGRRVFMATTIERFLFDMEFVMLVSRRKDLLVRTIDARLDEGIRFSRMNYRVLARESVNFLKVLFRGLRQ
ncbi:MAG: glycosyltransferase family 2 protein [Flavobacteriales bacterium]|nr:glycosyltransferase family 2 protein [Flavobacteriales bacterium]